MTEKAVERLKAKLIKQVGHRIAEGNWHWRGTEFMAESFCGVNSTPIYVVFKATFSSVSVGIRLKDDYGLSDRAKTFGGETAMADAVVWTAEQLIEADSLITARTMPYVEGHNNYLKALRGEE